MTKPTKAEAAAINDAASAIAYLSQTTNWSDAGAWTDAIKAERKQGLSLIEAKGKCVEQWFAGVTSPAVPACEIYHMRDGLLRARLLGVRHAIERAGSDYTGPLVRKAEALCPAAVQALQAHFARDIAAIKTAVQEAA